MFLNPITNQKMRNLQNYACCTPLNLRFDLDVWCFASERHFAALSLRFSLNLIAVQKMANLQNTNTCIIVFGQTYGAYHQNDTLKLFPQNCHLTPLRPKRLRILKQYFLSYRPRTEYGISQFFNVQDDQIVGFQRNRSKNFQTHSYGQPVLIFSAS